MLRLIKYFILCASSIIFFIQNQCSSAYGADHEFSSPIEDYNLELNGIILDADDNGLGGVDITVHEDTIIYLSEKSNRNGKSTIKLPLNRSYIIIFSKTGYISKSITINTSLPLVKIKKYKFSYMIYLFAKVEGLNFEKLNYPVADIIFNIFRFDYDANYTRGINKSVEKSYEQYYYLEARKSHISKNKINAKRKTNKRGVF